MKKNLVTSVVLVILVLFSLGLLGGLGTKQIEIDLNSGRIRTRIHVLRIPLVSRINSTRFAQAVERNGLNLIESDYRLIGMKSVGFQSLFGSDRRHGKLGDVPGALDGLMTLFDTAPELQQRESEILRRMIMWLKEEDVESIMEFVHELLDQVESASR